MSAERIGIWGFGREGAAALRWVRGRNPNADVLVADDDVARVAATAPDVEIAPFVALAGCELVYVSPGIRPTDARRNDLLAAGVKLTTGSDEFLRRAADRTVGVTGTKGKSTTTTFAHDLLRAEGVEVELGGNIGRPLLDLLDPATEAPCNDRAVFAIELSSYQCADLTVSPRVAVLTQLYDDHLLEHGTRDAYWRAKSRIFACGADTLVADAATLERLRPLAGDAIAAVPQVVAPAELADRVRAALPDHVAANLAAAAAGASRLLGRPLCTDRVFDVARAYAPLPHRLTPVSTVRGRLWVDDALATTQESALAALDAHAGKRIALLLGGRDRGQPIDRLAAVLAGRPEVRVLLVGETTGRFARTLADAGVHTVDVGTVAAAVRHVARRPDSEVEVVLLSPAAASYDQFRDHTEKGAAFAAAVAALERP